MSSSVTVLTRTSILEGFTKELLDLCGKPPFTREKEKDQSIKELFARVYKKLVTYRDPKNADDSRGAESQRSWHLLDPKKNLDAVNEIKFYVVYSDLPKIARGFLADIVDENKVFQTCSETPYYNGEWVGDDNRVCHIPADLFLPNEKQFVETLFG